MKEIYEAIVEEKKLKTKLAQYEPPQEEKRAELLSCRDTEKMVL